MIRLFGPLGALAAAAIVPSVAAHADPVAAQRGFAVYAQVCSACHSLRDVTFADLAGIGLDRTEIRALAASRSIADGVDPSGVPRRRPAMPTDRLPPPLVVPQPGQAVPPDLSRIALVLPGGAGTVSRILTGYHPAPPGLSVPPGSFYDPAAPGGVIAMPPPLADGVVTLADGTRPDVHRMAADVAAFLDWCAHPHRAERSRIGTGVVLYLLVLCVLLLLLKRRVWSNVQR
ncbi:MAG: hypothetical protein INR65_15105 [Gluconacetobacter diazotrophicus]|nr:hypothetical protein [Gluconacetobacter diazotrophicus]